MPETRPTTTQLSLPEGDPRPHQVSGRVLVVEDLVPLRAFVVAVIQALGVEVEVEAAADGLQALTLAKSAGQPFDLVVTDLNMPGMTGEELAHAVRALSTTTEFIFMTGFLEQSVHDALCSQHGGCTVLHKPFRSAALAEAVRASLSAHTQAPPG